MPELSKWANVALLARAGRLLQPTLQHTWQQAPPDALALYDRALALCETCAANARMENSLSQVETELTMLVGKFELHFHGPPAGITRPLPSFEAFRPHIPESDADARNISDILDVGARGVRVASAIDAQSIEQETMDGLSWAYSVMESIDNPTLAETLTANTNELNIECATKSAGDSSTVQWVDGRWSLSLGHKPWWLFWKG